MCDAAICNFAIYNEQIMKLTIITLLIVLLTGCTSPEVAINQEFEVQVSNNEPAAVCSNSCENADCDDPNCLGFNCTCDQCSDKQLEECN